VGRGGPESGAGPGASDAGVANVGVVVVYPVFDHLADVEGQPQGRAERAVEPAAGAGLDGADGAAGAAAADCREQQALERADSVFDFAA